MSDCPICMCVCVYNNVYVYVYVTNREDESSMVLNLTIQLWRRSMLVGFFKTFLQGVKSKFLDPGGS